MVRFLFFVIFQSPPPLPGPMVNGKLHGYIIATCLDPRPHHPHHRLFLLSATSTSALASLSCPWLSIGDRKRYSRPPGVFIHNAFAVFPHLLPESCSLAFFARSVDLCLGQSSHQTPAIWPVGWRFPARTSRIAIDSNISSVFRLSQLTTTQLSPRTGRHSLHIGFFSGRPPT